jgi:rSAM/selenodomain-associated transferase 1
MAMSEPVAVAVAVLAKAPIPGFAKTRLIPALGAERAALLQARLIERAVTTACTAAVGPVTLWLTHHENQHGLSDLQARRSIGIDYQNDGDLGARMHAAAIAANGYVLIMGTDCPALEPRHLRSAAVLLRSGTDVVLIPAEDGGYVLIGMHSPHPELFSELPWGTSRVVEETRRRIKDSGLSWQEPFILWDLDTAADIARLREHELAALLA